MSNVVQLRKSELLKACEEVEKMNPDTWVVVGMSDKSEEIRVIGNDNFDMVRMYGMLEYAKSKIEPRTNNEPTPKRIG